jgi:Zn-dependent M28 family amino/carboxypeptidase
VSGLRNELRATLEALAALGQKRVGTEEGMRAAEYLRARMSELGLEDVGFESFHFPRHEVVRSALELTLDGRPFSVGYDVLEGCGDGVVDGEVVSVGEATDEILSSLALPGKVALVERNPLYHRSTQYSNVAAAGAAAMLSISAAPDNLRQVGSVRRAWETSGPVPALAVGAADGGLLKRALDGGLRVRARLEVEVELSRGRGQNVVGRIRGQRRHQIVIGAHYDTWFAGSTDNGGGVAALLALAARRAQGGMPQYTLVFVGWDGEEIALYGGYDYLRRHLVAAREPILAVIDFETPSAHGAQVYGLARSSQPPLEAAIAFSELAELFAVTLPMDLVAELFGGVIPTDIQGMYRGGTPAISTAVDSPYYHTVEDTPDKVDLERLETTVLAFDRALDALLEEQPERFAHRDAALWRLELSAHPSGDELIVDVRVFDASGEPQRAAVVEAVLLYDHFFEAATRAGRSDFDGGVRLVFAPAEWQERAAPRFLHVTAGIRYPLVETVVALD